MRLQRREHVGNKIMETWVGDSKMELISGRSASSVSAAHAPLNQERRSLDQISFRCEASPAPSMDIWRGSSHNW